MSQEALKYRSKDMALMVQLLRSLLMECQQKVWREKDAVQDHYAGAEMVPGQVP